MSVIKEKNPKKWTKDGRKWYFDVYYTDMYGNRKEKKSKMYKSSTQAEKAKHDFLNSIKTKDIVNEDITFVSLYDEWLNFKHQSVKESTFYVCKKKCDKHILKFFSPYKLHSIKLNSIHDWKKEIKKCDMTLRSENMIIGYLKEILEYAKDNYDFDNKIVAKIQKNRCDIIPVNKITDNYLTYDDYKSFIKSVDDEFYKLIFEFLYYTGLRIGEMFALTWNDINLDKKVLSIKKSLSTKIDNKKYIITTPKTKNSIRDIDLDDNLVEKLKEHYNHEKKIYNFSKEMFIFGNVRYIAETTLRRKLNKYLNIANIKNKITLHGFRHSHVSLLIYLGCDIYEVAERIGDTVEMVEKIYYHMFPDKKSHTVKVLNNLKNAR